MLKKLTFNRLAIIAFIVMILILFSMLIIEHPANAQTNPPLDDNEPIQEISLWFDGVLQKTELVGVSTVDQSIHYLEITSGGTISRAATVVEIESYNDYVNQVNKTDALLALQADPEFGVNYRQWVSNRTAELLQCETDLGLAQGLGNWTTFSNGEKNAVMAAIIQCEIDGAKLDRKQINSLLDLFIVEGIIE